MFFHFFWGGREEGVSEGCCLETTIYKQRHEANKSMHPSFTGLGIEEEKV